MLCFHHFRSCLIFFLLLYLPSACVTNKTIVVGATASLLEDIAESASKQSDLRLIREGMPSYLMLIDGMVEAVPDNEHLLITAAQSYASFAAAFIQDEDKEYAKVLYGRARNYAIRALEQIGFNNPLTRPFDDFEQALNALSEQDIKYIFWAASCWGNWISLNLGSVEALAELPRVELMMKRVLKLDEGFYYGGAHIFMGILYGSRPKIAGGDLERAKEHFLKAIELGRGEFLFTYIYYANYYAKKAFAKDSFVATLETVLKTPADIKPELTLLNSVARRKAEEMLKEVDEYF